MESRISDTVLVRWTLGACSRRGAVLRWDSSDRRMENGSKRERGDKKGERLRRGD